MSTLEELHKNWINFSATAVKKSNAAKIANQAARDAQCNRQGYLDELARAYTDCMAKKDHGDDSRRPLDCVFDFDDSELLKDAKDLDECRRDNFNAFGDKFHNTIIAGRVRGGLFFRPTGQVFVQQWCNRFVPGEPVD